MTIVFSEVSPYLLSEIQSQPCTIFRTSVHHLGNCTLLKPLVLLYMCVYQCLTKDSKDSLVGIQALLFCTALYFVLFLFVCFVLFWYPVSVIWKYQLCLSSVILILSALFPHYSKLWSNAWSRKLFKVECQSDQSRMALLVSFFSEIMILHLLLSSIWKQLF